MPTKKNLIKIKSAAYAADTVTLSLKKPLKITKSLELIVQGTAPSGLQDAEGRLIDGADTGSAGSNAVAVLSKGGGVKINAIPAGPMAASAPPHASSNRPAPYGRHSHGADTPVGLPPWGRHSADEIQPDFPRHPLPRTLRIHSRSSAKSRTIIHSE